LDLQQWGRELSTLQQEGVGSRTAGGRRKQHAAGKMHGRATWIGSGRKGGVSEDGGEEMQLSSCTHNKCSRRPESEGED